MSHSACEPLKCQRAWKTYDHLGNRLLDRDDVRYHVNEDDAVHVAADRPLPAESLSQVPRTEVAHRTLYKR